MTLFGRELTLEQLIGFVKCNAAPTEDLVHMAALELIAALQDAQRRERAAVEEVECLLGYGFVHGAFNPCELCNHEKVRQGDEPCASCENNQNVRGSWEPKCGPQEAGEESR